MELSTKSDDLLIGVVGGGAMGQGIVQVSLEGGMKVVLFDAKTGGCLLYTSPSPRDATLSRMPSSA